MLAWDPDRLSINPLPGLVPLSISTEVNDSGFDVAAVLVAVAWRKLPDRDDAVTALDEPDATRDPAAADPALLATWRLAAVDDACRESAILVDVSLCKSVSFNFIGLFVY